MSEHMIVQVWKEPQLRSELSPEQLAAMPSHPSGDGLGELTEVELRGVGAPFGAASGWVCTITDECPNSVFVCC